MSSARQTFCKLFLKEVCFLTDDMMKKYIHMERPVRIFNESDKGFTGDSRYDAPVGWCYMKLKHLPSDPAVDINWDYCYHGTQTKYVSSILKNRLALPGTRTADGMLVEIQPGHVGGNYHIYTSPSIHYASHYVYAWPTKWTHDGKTYYVRVVFQVKQKKGTYRIDRMTLSPACWDPTVRLDDGFRNEEIEWISDDPRSIAVEGILIHFSETAVEDLVKQRELSRKGKHVEIPMSVERDNFQYNMDVTKMMILWVDDNPGNNDDLVKIIQDCGVTCVCRRDTESALRELRDHASSYFAAITDMVRFERRTGDSSTKPYYEAGIDFIKSVRNMGLGIPVYMYSSWCRSKNELCTKSLDVGATKICTHSDIVYIIRRD